MKRNATLLILALAAAPLLRCRAAETALLPESSDTQVHILDVQSPKPPVDPKKTPDHYLSMEDVPLASALKMLAKECGLPYFESASALEAIGDDNISLNMVEPQPRPLFDSLLKMKGLELFQQGELSAIRKYTNQVSCYVHQLRDNFFEQMSGSGSSSAIGSGGGGGGMGGGGGGGMGGTTSASISAKNNTWQSDDKWMETIKGIIKEEGSENNLVYNPEKQLLILYGTTTAEAKLSRYLEIVDTKKNPNIYLMARIYATSSNPIEKMGVDWSPTLQNGMSFSLNNPSATTGTSGTTGAGGSSTATAGMSLDALSKAIKNPMSAVIASPNLQAVLNFFAQDSTAESIAEPSALTANNREVAFGATTKIPYIGGSGSTGVSSVQGGSSMGNSYDTTTFVEVGTTLNILPRIQSGRRLRVGTALSISQLDAFIPVSVADGVSRQVPQTSGRAYSGEYTLNSGDTIIIAGLKQNQQTAGKTKVPWLGDIPVLGKLFRNESNNKSVSYLTILITPTIVEDGNTSYASVAKLKPEDHLAKPGSLVGADPNAAVWTRASEYSDDALTNAKATRERDAAKRLEDLAKQRQIELQNRERIEGQYNKASTQERQAQLQKEMDEIMVRLNSIDALERAEQEALKAQPKPASKSTKTENAKLLEQLDSK